MTLRFVSDCFSWQAGLVRYTHDKDGYFGLRGVLIGHTWAVILFNTPHLATTDVQFFGLSRRASLSSFVYLIDFFLCLVDRDKGTR